MKIDGMHITVQALEAVLDKKFFEATWLLLEKNAPKNLDKEALEAMRYAYYLGGHHLLKIILQPPPRCTPLQAIELLRVELNAYADEFKDEHDEAR